MAWRLVSNSFFLFVLAFVLDLAALLVECLLLPGEAKVLLICASTQQVAFTVR